MNPNQVNPNQENPLAGEEEVHHIESDDSSQAEEVEVPITEFCPMLNNEQFKVPCFSSGCTNAQNNNQTYNCCQQKDLLMWMNQQPNWLGLFLHREQDQQCSTGEVCWKY